MTMTKISFRAAASALVLLAGTANATTVTWDSAFATATANSQGSSLSLTVVDGAIAGTWDIKLVIDSTNYFGSLPGLNQVGFGAIQGWTHINLVSFTAGTWGSAVGSVVNNFPCTSDTGHFKVCVNGFVDIVNNPGAYEWNFVATGGTVLNAYDWHVGAQYNVDPIGTSNGNIISTSSSPIPEPSAALVFAIGMGAVSRSVRRKASS